MKQKLLLSLFTFSVMASSPVMSQDWWFEIEVIMFKRDITPELVNEQFTPNYQRYSADFDLIGQFLNPDITTLIEGIPVCYADEPAFSFISDFSFHHDIAARHVTLDALWSNKAWQSSDTPMTDLDLYLLGIVDAVKMASNASHNQVHVNNKHNALAPQPIKSVVLPNSLYCKFDNEVFAWPNQKPNAVSSFASSVPKIVDGIAKPFSGAPYLIPAKALKLKRLARDINRQRNVSELLHLGWRQHVPFGQSKAPALRLIAGENFAKRFDSTGQFISLDNEQLIEDDNQPTAISSDLFDTLNAQLDNNQDIDHNTILAMLNQVEKPDDERGVQLNELWQLDGFIKVFLRRIRNVPYLHIDSEMAYRVPVISDDNLNKINNSDTPVEPDLLKSYEFKQLRRVISKQIHYFDHPLFGMVVQIRRHTPPQPEDQLTSNNVE
ncbi:peptidoglycan binding protein CsiV [Aestuariibacter sp. AA17]|uniref:Peptidoglycan binding protein CsiV n=1 Tax=Fluctibacter corallii TaxID=2984329 RepID=A0ABT3A987_9ALTE|nr:peptidoglycan binding protein CsiV [Aestuariibacter sp. AA17]MCV2885193.1 peptidoglycan binding protein CsiV [Aestuariibacter sp. AA17]